MREPPLQFYPNPLSPPHHTHTHTHTHDIVTTLYILYSFHSFLPRMRTNKIKSNRTHASCSRFETVLKK